MDNREFAELLLCEAAEILNEGIFKKDKSPKVDYLVKFNNPRSWNRIKNKIVWCEYTSKQLNDYPCKWRKLLREYNKEIDTLIKNILDSKDLEKDSAKIFVKIGVIKIKYSNKIQDFINEIDSNIEWSNSTSSTNDIELFIKDLYDFNLCYTELVMFNKDLYKKSKEDAIVKKFDREISAITELFYSEIITKICNSIKIAHN